MEDNNVQSWSGPVTHVPEENTRDINGFTQPQTAPGNTQHTTSSKRFHCKVKTQVKVTNQGTLDISVDDAAAELSNVLKPVLDEHVGKHALPKYPSRYIPAVFAATPNSMNIVVHIVGSRGDVQPFISLGIVLKKTYHHRVRIATHLVFKQLVEENGLEFFNIGGDPAELMAFMVKNPGLLPDLHTLASGEVGKRRKGIYEILNGCWRSCIEPGDGTGPVPKTNHFPYHYNTISPFIADAIIANPPSFAHVHCAEKLGVPLHMMFTMPWSPTQSFPHPLVNIRSTNTSSDVANYVSYTLVDMLTWQGLGDVINKFRRTALNLEPISVMWAPGMTNRLRIPFTYCWSPALIPKPKDWANHISISGFYFLPLASSYTPDKELIDFLEAGPPPVYIGFGSIVVDDPDAMTRMIFEAVESVGVRALVSKGWGGLGAHELGKPSSIFMLGNIPHDWLFQRVAAVVHHGGAGTTAAGVLAGKPTVVVPFFGDQPFWGAMIARAGAGPEPIPYKKLTAESLAGQLRKALAPETAIKAKELGKRIASEQGSDLGAKYFHDALDANMACALLPGRVAAWRLKKTNVLLSPKAAAILGRRLILQEDDFKLHRSMEYETQHGPTDPVSGVVTTLVGTLGSLAVSVADLPTEAFHSLKTKVHKDSVETDKVPVKTDVSKRNESFTSQLSTKMSEDSNQAFNTGNVEFQEILDENSTRQGETKEETAIPDASINPTPETVMTAVASSPRSLEAIAAKHPHLPADRIARLTTHSDTKVRNQNQQVRERVKGGFVRAAEVGLGAPMDLAGSVAQGFHNVPTLYRDTTVRPQENVTGFQSGLKAAGVDFVHGIYDGVTGVITQPINGAKEGGVGGFVAGVGKGLGGLILKPTGAIFSVPADTIKGVYKELQKTGDTRLEEHIRKSRMAQGGLESDGATEEEMDELVKQWKIVEQAAKQPHLNRAQTLAHNLSWKLHGDGISKNGEIVNEPSQTNHYGLREKLGHHHKASQSEPAKPPDTTQPSHVNAETAPIPDHMLDGSTR